VTAALVIAIAGTGASTGHLSERDGHPIHPKPAPDAGPSRSEKCHARAGLRFYVRRYGEHAARMGAAQGTVNHKTARCPLYLANVWKRKSFAMRMRVERFFETRTLHDFAFADGNHAWPKAVREVQRVFPGTEGWLLSCSAAEGGHGRWVGYSGVAYSTWLRDSDTVGGPLQFRFSTFTGMYRRAVDYVTGHGYRVPRMDFTSAWRSALGQALAGGWARYTGNDKSHWSASWGRGC
jgi:hypothetical protein